MNNFNELTAGVHRLEHTVAHRFIDCAVNQTAHNTQIDIGVQKGGFNLIHRFANIAFRYPSGAREALDNPREGFGEPFKHSSNLYTQLRHRVNGRRAEGCLRFYRTR